MAMEEKMSTVAKGRFTLDQKSGRTQHLLLATVTRIAPFVSYVRTHVQRLAKREQSHARQPQALLSADHSQGRCTMRPCPNPNQIKFSS
jgi:ferredoxin-NADP reductase